MRAEGTNSSSSSVEPLSPAPGKWGITRRLTSTGSNSSNSKLGSFNDALTNWKWHRSLYHREVTKTKLIILIPEFKYAFTNLWRIAFASSGIKKVKNPPPENQCRKFFFKVHKTLISIRLQALAKLHLLPSLAMLSNQICITRIQRTEQTEMTKGRERESREEREHYWLWILMISTRDSSLYTQ